MTDSAQNTSGLSSNVNLNGYVHHCDTVMHRKYYSVCLHLIDSVHTDMPLSSAYDSCVKAINNKKGCPALRMKKEEQESGKPIYFIKRGEVVTGELKQKSLTPIKKSNTKSVEKKEEILPGASMTFADAINHNL